MIVATQTVRDLKKVNRHKVLSELYFSAPISRLDISQRLGLSPATVGSAVSELMNQDIITSLGAQETQGGRPRILLDINANYGFFIGIEAGETYIHIELVNLKLIRIAEIHRPVTSNDTQPNQIIDHIVEGIETLLTQAHIPMEKVLGVGIGVPGIVDRQMGVSICAPNWDWNNVPLLDRLRTRLQAPIYIDNGAHTMALAEKMFGAGQGIDNLAVLLIGSGVGAGLVIGGELYRGASNSVGEWGHTCVELNGRACSCGSRGCLEAYIGAPGIIARLRSIDSAHPALNAKGQIAIIEAIKRTAQDGNGPALKVVDETAHYLGAGIANLVNLFNPQVILIGGWLGLLLGEGFLNLTIPYVERYVLKPPLGAVQIQLSALQQDSVSVGAASLALEGFLRTSTSGSH